MEVLSGLVDQEVGEVLSNQARFEVVGSVNLPFVKVLFSMELNTVDGVVVSFEGVNELTTFAVGSDGGDLQVTRKLIAGVGK